jgi:hypothetical protein
LTFFEIALVDLILSSSTMEPSPTLNEFLTLAKWLSFLDLNEDERFNNG